MKKNILIFALSIVPLFTFAQSKEDVEKAVSYFFFVNCTDFGDYTGWLNDVQTEDYERRGFFKLAEECGWDPARLPKASTTSFENAEYKYNTLPHKGKYLNWDYIAGYQYTLCIDKIEFVNATEALAHITLKYNDNILSSTSKVNVNRVDDKRVKIVKQNGRWLVDDISISTEPLTYFKEFIHNIPQPAEEPKPKRAVQSTIPEGEKVYTLAMVEQKPEFPGGDAAMYKWVNIHLSYPAQAAEEGVSGRVMVQFVVTKTGDIANVEVIEGRHPALDKEAVRLVKAMPKWSPAQNNGEIVNCYYTLPVVFSLQD